MIAPFLYRWSGTAMEPLPRFARRCDEQFVVGEVYRLDAVEERSQASHSHYFAALSDRWQSLPDRLAIQFPTVEHLRKHCLCMTGFRDERSFVASSKAEAVRLAAFLRPIDDYAIVSVNECVVVVWTAKSQSFRAMGKKDFNASKQAVLDYCDDLLGIKAEANAA